MAACSITYSLPPVKEILLSKVFVLGSEMPYHLNKNNNNNYRIAATRATTF
jgi:hypothetical protein